MLFFVLLPHRLKASDIPQDFVEIKKIIPNIKLDMRYFSSRNFIGKKIDGYEASKCYLQRSSAEALKKVQKGLINLGLELYIYDCYRPQMAVDHFVRWAIDQSDTKMKSLFYPDVPKTELFKRGYIAEKSGHSKGNTIDLGLIKIGSNINKLKKLKLNDCRKPLNKKALALGLLDMGTQYDCFDSLSHTRDTRISSKVKRNRLILKGIMEINGFKNYSKEWWHFSFKVNSYPNTYHNFKVQ